VASCPALKKAGALAMESWLPCLKKAGALAFVAWLPCTAKCRSHGLQGLAALSSEGRSPGPFFYPYL